MLCKPPATFSGSSLYNFSYCKGFELLLSLWLPMTLFCSYGRTVSSARRLILLYDFLSQGKGGKLPISCSDCADHMNLALAGVLIAWAISHLIFFFVFISKYHKPLPLLSVQNWGFIKSGFVLLMFSQLIVADNAVLFQFCFTNV